MAKRKPLDYNWAKNEDFANDCRHNLINFWNMVRAEREFREVVWQKSYRAWTNDRTDSDKGYNGRADISLPQIRKEVETMSRRIYKGLFPEDYLKAEPNRLADEELAVVNTQLTRHYLDNVMNIRSFAMPWIKQGVIYGTSPARTFWTKKENEQFLKERYFVSNKEGIMEPRTKVVQKKVVNYNGPETRAEDLFQTWIYPFYADKPENIKMHFWRTKVSKYDLKLKSEQGMCHKFDTIKDDGNTEDWSFDETQERLQQFGETGLLKSVQPDSIFTLLEIWCELLLPGEDYPVPCVVEIVNENYVTRIQRNPYWHQRAPFDYMRYILPPPGEFYGRGLPEASISLQEQVNDTLNQTMDSTTLSLNNITIINPAYAPNAESFEIEPGAIWWADPNAVKQFQFPDLTNVGIKNVGMLRGFITELSDNSPQLPDPIAGKARSTGQAQLAVNEWQTDLFTILELVTSEALNSLAQKVHVLLQQNVSDDDVVRITGKYSGKWVNRVVTPEQIVGSYDFKWMGALQIESQSIKVQQMLNFMKIYQTLPPDAQQQIKLNWENLAIKLVRDGFMIKDVENVIETERLNASTPANIEEKILKLGGEIKVEYSDDDDLHIQMHRKWAQGEKDKYLVAKMEKHIAEHVDQKTKKQQEAQMMAMQMQMMAAQAGGGGATGRPEGNPGVIPEATNQPDIERGMRVEQ